MKWDQLYSLFLLQYELPNSHGQERWQRRLNGTMRGNKLVKDKLMTLYRDKKKYNPRLSAHVPEQKVHIENTLTCLRRCCLYTEGSGSVLPAHYCSSLELRGIASNFLLAIQFPVCKWHRKNFMWIQSYPFNVSITPCALKCFPKKEGVIGRLVKKFQ